MFVFSLLFWTELSFVITVTLIAIGFIVYFVLRYRKIYEKVLQRFRHRTWDRRIKETYEKLKNNRTKCLNLLNILRMQVTESVDQGKISKSHYETLDKKISG